MSYSLQKTNSVLMALRKPLEWSPEWKKLLLRFELRAIWFLSRGYRLFTTWTVPWVASSTANFRQSYHLPLTKTIPLKSTPGEHSHSFVHIYRISYSQKMFLEEKIYPVHVKDMVSTKDNLWGLKSHSLQV